MRLFFSRRIGLSSSNQAIPILGGTRLTGRVGRSSIGALSIQQREDDGVPSTNFTALRLRRDILANSDVGAVLLDKEEDGPHFNRVAGIDANFRFGFLTMDGYAVRTFSPEGVLGGSGEEFAARGSANYQTRTWGFRGHYATIGEGFNDEVGFVPRRGVNNLFLSAGRSFRPAWLSRFGVRETRPHWQMDVFTRRDGTGLESRYYDFHWPLNFHDGAMIEAGVNPNVEVVRQPFTINGAPGGRVDPGRYEFNEWFVLWNTSTAKRFSFTSRYSIGEFYDGHRRGYSFGPSLRLSEHLNATLNLQINDIELSNGAFVSKLVNGRLNYNFNTKMFVNALVQYNTDLQQWSSNLRFNVIHRPLSDFFLVYNEGRDERAGRVDRAVIAKMTYLMAF